MEHIGTITKKIIDAGLTQKFPVVVLSDESTSDEVILDRNDYSFFRTHEGMTDQEIMQFAGVI